MITGRNRDTAASDGALPSPEVLRAYEDVRPGLAARMVALTERHRDLAERQLAVEVRRQEQIHSAAMTHLTAVHGSGQRGRWLGFILACATLGLSAVLIAILP